MGAGGVYRRELHDYIVVSVDGTRVEVDPEVASESPVRVVIALPDFAADALAHAVAQAWEVARALGGESPFIGEGERELAEALYEAVSAAGYACPTGGLHLPSAPALSGR